MAEERSSDYVLYKHRPEWADVKPMPVDDMSASVVQIAYSEKFRDVYDYFRAILDKQEKSERALALTEDAISLNPANYTAWQYRRMLLRELKCDFRDEVVYTSSVIDDSPKNYQVWFHRQMIMEWLNDPTGELDFIRKVLEDDAKNYHAWQYRQWVVDRFSLWDGELEFVDLLLQEDLRNNSAWNHRFFVISNKYKYGDEVIEREVVYAQTFIQKAPNNESSWNYLRGVLQQSDSSLGYPGLLDFCQVLYQNSVRSPFLLLFIVEIHGDVMEKRPETRKELLPICISLLDEMAMEFDTIRVQYYEYLKRQYSLKFGG